MEAIKKDSEELRKLKRRVKELEVEVEQLKKKDRDNMALEIVTWTVAIIELATAIIALAATLASRIGPGEGEAYLPPCFIRISQEGDDVNENHKNDFKPWICSWDYSIRSHGELRGSHSFTWVCQS